MKEKRNCEIVQDLLPSYIDNLTSEGTNKFIEEHLQECKECKEVYETMKSEISSDGAKPNKKEVDYMKKYRSKLKIATSVIKTISFMGISVLFVYSILVISRLLILNDFTDKAMKYVNYDNMYGVMKTLKDESVEYEYWKKGNITLLKMYENGEIEHIEWSNNETGEVYFIQPKAKRASHIFREFSDEFSGENAQNLEFKNFMQSLKIAANLSLDIKREFIAKYTINEYCYIIERPDSNVTGSYFPGEKEFFDNRSGLQVGSSNGTSHMIYEFDSVTDEDVAIPDLSEYEIYEINNL